MTLATKGLTMKRSGYLALAIVATATFTGGGAWAATCVAGNLTCPTTMPVDGYCECRAHGTTTGGTVVEKPASQRPVNATAGGCPAHSTAPGCHS
jgi:hypothetical protein